MANPFDFKTILMAKHAQHVVLIHFPIALFIAAVAFDYLAQWTKNRALAAAAHFNVLLAAISTVPVVVTGLAAWQWALEGQKLTGILLLHLILGCVSSVLIWIVFWIHRRVHGSPERSFATLPSSDRSAHRIDCRADGTSRRLSKWCERTGLESSRNLAS
ncbi:MAG TPA: DUF2231 domain-containing protein [Terriglobales bacterium]|nr:DUF2231 domain-containing protein [Terriglobales bacterium]